MMARLIGRVMNFLYRFFDSLKTGGEEPLAQRQCGALPGFFS
jgi:hypothetical protein